jgi:anti-anti-sigma regulatory factor
MAVPMSTTEMFLSIEEERMVAALQEVAAGLDGSAGEAVLDFSSVRRIDSSTLQALQDLVRVAEDRGVKVVLRGVNVDVYKVLKLVNLTQRFSFLH